LINWNKENAMAGPERQCILEKSEGVPKQCPPVSDPCKEVEAPDAQPK